MYGFRHYFASKALGNGLSITDVAEWMGHKSIEETYRTYRHLTPGSTASSAPCASSSMVSTATCSASCLVGALPSILSTEGGETRRSSSGGAAPVDQKSLSVAVMAFAR
ncbi:tyrosine-type recombinase/integrase [Streptomyces sp. NPDC004327]|uniref:tyrosine-type recombinase/integrase n=1 Tax=Streptomyces sp. NPDC004327 TaxID=3364699 RepID=UPI003683FCD2